MNVIQASLDWDSAPDSGAISVLAASAGVRPPMPAYGLKVVACRRQARHGRVVLLHAAYAVRPSLNSPFYSWALFWLNRFRRCILRTCMNRGPAFR